MTLSFVYWFVNPHLYIEILFLETLKNEKVDSANKMSFRSELEKAWSKASGGLPLPDHVSTQHAEERLERIKQEEIRKIIAEAMPVARELQIKKLKEREHEARFYQEWNQHYLTCVQAARRRLGLNDQEPIDSREIAKEMEPFRPQRTPLVETDPKPETDIRTEDIALFQRLQQLSRKWNQAGSSFT